jgi:hypothetical protein
VPLIATVKAVRRRRWLLAARAHAGALARPAAPAVKRRAPLSFPSRVFPSPVLTRILFGGASAPVATRDLVALLGAPSLDEAAAAADRMRTRRCSGVQARVLEELRALALGGDPTGEMWGEDPAADLLRLRRLRWRSTPALPPPGWGRFLAWAGARLETAPLGKLPPPLARVAAASLAAVRGYRGAFEALIHRGRIATAWARPLAIVALRCALDGVFLPQLVAFLLPRSRRREADGSDPWAPALLALHAYHVQHNVAGIVHLTAALVAADLRERLVGFAGRETTTVLRRRWGARLPPEAEGALADAALLLRVKAHLVERFVLNPWRRDWGGPDVSGVVQAVGRVLGRGGGTLAFEVFLDDRLAVAALFAAIGYTPSALAQLAQAQVGPALLEACAALDAAPQRPLAEPSAVLPEGRWGAAGERVFQRLRSTPEPSVELASPHWLLGEARGALMSRLVAEGRVEAARAVRPVLDREDLRRDLAPFWILPGTAEDTAAVSALAAWLAARERATLHEAEWLRFIEDTCRRLQRQES